LLASKRHTEGDLVDRILAVERGLGELLGFVLIDEDSPTPPADR
jgi:hypothetical protein